MLQTKMQKVTVEICLNKKKKQKNNMEEIGIERWKKKQAERAIIFRYYL